MNQTDSRSNQDSAGQMDLTTRVGAQVRTTRSRRGLTRKNLAYHSDVSERYLARLEAGEANISLVLLARIAQALDVSLLSLLPVESRDSIKYEPLGKLISSLEEREQERAYHVLHREFSSEDAKRTGIALVGLRGAGKTTLGERLAQRFKVPFVRLDEVIHQMSGLDMGELISLTGQKVFRRYELEALQKTLSDYRQVVVETGGSLVSETDTYSLLRSRFFTVWIRALPEEHMERVSGQGDLRPMAGSRQPMNDLKLILDERSEDYRLADYELMTSKRSIEDCLDELSRIANPYLQ